MLRGFHLLRLALFVVAACAAAALTPDAQAQHGGMGGGFHGGMGGFHGGMGGFHGDGHFHGGGCCFFGFGFGGFPLYAPSYAYPPYPYYPPYYPYYYPPAYPYPAPGAPPAAYGAPSY